MKIKDVVIREAGETSQRFPLSPQAQAALTGQGGQRKVAAKSDPSVLARQQELIAAGAKIKADGVMGDKTRTAEKQFGPKVDAAKGSQSAGTATTVTNPAQAVQATDRFAGQANTDARTGQNNLGVATAEPAAAANPGTAAAGSAFNQAAGSSPGTPAPADDLARMTQLAGAGNGGGYGNFTGGQQTATPAPAQAAQAAEPAAAPAPGEFTPVPSGYNTTAPAVTDRSGNQIKTGSGGTLTSRSDDELAWASKQPMGGTGQQYPGAGNWDPKTGRDLKAAAQGEKNWQSIKNFFGGKKQAPAAPAAPGTAAAGPAFNQGTQPAGQAGQTAPSGAAGAMAAMKEADDAVLATIRKIR